MAAYYFFEYHRDYIDYAIFEVGIGGTLDATNIIPHDISVITKIGFDHEAILGENLLEIAKNKFGIISNNNLVFHADFDPMVENLCGYYSQKYSARFVKSYDYAFRVDVSKDIPTFYLITKFGEYRMNLHGKRAAENTILAITVFDHIIVNSYNYLYAIGKVNWPGRMERISYTCRSNASAVKTRDVYLSGDHNPMGIDSLLEILRYYRFKNVHFVVGICRDKKYKKMLNSLIDFPNANLYLTETPIKTLHIDEYGEEFIKRAKISSANPMEALEAAIGNALKDDLVVVTGSLYLVGYVRAWHTNEKK